MINQPATEHYLKLSANPRQFKPSAPTTNVFFDNTNGQIFSVELGDETKIFVNGKTQEDSFEFKIKDKGIVKSIKFSPNNEILALQRSRNVIEFILMINPSQEEFGQSSKNKKNKIYGFEWINNKELVMITDQTVEIYEIDVKKISIKLIKSLTIGIHWFVYDYKTNLLLLSTGGNYNNILQPFQLLNCGEINKLSRFEIEMFHTPSQAAAAGGPVVSPVSSSKLLVLEEDVVLTYAYHLPRILIIRHQQRGSSTTQVVVYTIYKYKTVKKTHTLDLSDQMDGKFAINMTDNLILVHHKTSRTTMVFDIQLTNEAADGIVSYKLPLTAAKPIQPLPNYETYSCNWVMFEPDIIIDVKKGLLFHIELDIKSICHQFSNNKILFEFLILRNIDKEHVLDLLRKVFLEGTDFMEMVQFIEKINFYYQQYLNYQVQINMGKSVSFLSLNEYSTVQDTNEISFVKYNYIQRIIIDQTLFYNTIFIQLYELKPKDKILVSLLIEYIKSLTDHSIEVDFYIYELLIKTLILNEKFSQLHQILQYYIVKDSKQIACLLLPLENIYKPAYQISLDMLHRLKAYDEINHILLYERNNMITTLRYNILRDDCIRNLGVKIIQNASSHVKSASSSRMTAACEATSTETGVCETKHGKNKRDDYDVLVFYSVFKYYVQYCKQYNFNLFQQQKMCRYIELFQDIFDET